MFGKMTKRLLAFLLAGILAVSNMSFVYAADGDGTEGIGTGGAGSSPTISGQGTITENGTYIIEEGSTGSITIDATEVTLIGAGVNTVFGNLSINCTKEGTSLTIQDVAIHDESRGGPTIGFTGAGNYLYLKGTNLIERNIRSGGYAMIHVGPGTELTIDNAEDGDTVGTLYYFINEEGAGIGGNKFEVNGDITIAGGNIFGYGNRRSGASIGTGASAGSTDNQGDIRITGGELNLVNDYAMALIGCGSGNSGNAQGKIYISGGTVTLNNASTNQEELAIGGELYKDEGEVFITGGSLLITKGRIDAKKIVNENGESVHLLTLDASEINADTYHVEVDGVSYYERGLHRYGATGTLSTNDIMSNWTETTDKNLYLYLSKGEHTVSVNGTSYLYNWNDEKGTFEKMEIVEDTLKTGKTGNGEITVSQTQPNIGETVEVAAIPAEGSYLAQIRYSYTDAQGDTVYQVVNPDANGAYKFAMPADSAQVTADFVPIVWDGTIDVTWYDPDATIYNIKYAAQLAGVAAINNGIFNNYPSEENSSAANVPATDENGMPKGSTDSLYNVYGSSEEQTAVVGDITYIVAQSGLADENENSSIYWYGKEDYRGKTINLTADVDMGGTYTDDKYDGTKWSGPNYMPIGGQYCMDNTNENTLLNSTFNGIFNGQGHLVNNIYCNRASDSENVHKGQSVGLIGHMGSYDGSSLSPYADPDVKNVAVDGCIMADDAVGGIVGMSSSPESVVQSCMNFAMVESTSGKGESAGGIIGSAHNSLTIKSCVNFGFIYGSGICAISNEAQIFDSYNVGSIRNGESSLNGGPGLGLSVDVSDSEGGNYNQYEHPTWLNCYWFTRVNAPGTSVDPYFGSNITKITSISNFRDSSFLGKLNSTGEGSLLQLHDFYENKQNVKINATGRDWVSGSGAAFVSDGIKNALSNVKIYTYAQSTYTLEGVDCTKFPVPRTFTQDESVFTGTISTTDKPKTEYVSELEFDMSWTEDDKDKTRHTLRIWAEYSDGTKEAITDYKVTTETGGTKLTVNDTKVTISGNYKGKPFSFEYDITVTANKVENIAITNVPRNVLYAAGEIFDTTGMVVKATYSNGQVLEISDYTVTSPVLKAGDNEVTIGYTYAGDTRYVRQPVTVLESAAPTLDDEGRAQLRTANDMLWFANQVNTGINQSINGILMDDIDLSGVIWTPIGKFVFGGSIEYASIERSILYEGILDGNGKTVKFDDYLIKNSSASLNEGQPYGGLCALLGSEGVIKNITLDGSITVTEGSQGAIAGLVYGGTIIGCTNNADINGTGAAEVAGIAGKVTYGGEILDCVNNGMITSTGFASGIASQITSKTLISRCINKGDVSAKSTAAGIAGRLVNWSDGNTHDRNEDCTITYCGNEGAISSGYIASGIFGGLDSDSSYYCNIYYCYNSSKISVSSETVARGYVSGIAREAWTIESCYNSGDLAGSVPGTLYIAGLSISNSTSSFANKVIKNSYNAGKITAEGETCYVGSIFTGYDSEFYNDYEYPAILNNYALTGTADRLMGGTGIITDANAAFVTSEELKALTTTLGEAYREGHISVNGGYPLLAWQALGTVELVDKAISELGTITLESKTAIETVRAAYEALSDEEKQYVTKYSVLEEAEQTYRELAEEMDREAAAAVDGLIEEIGTVTLDSKEVIKTAREAYDALTSDQKLYVTKLEILKTAESTYAALEKLEEDKKAAAEVDGLIGNIGTVTLESKADITAAREAYEKLTSDQKALVTKLATLEAAEERLEKLSRDKEAADQVIARISALPDVLTLSYEEAVKEAREAYEALSADQKALVSNTSKLANAEAVIEILKEAVQKALEQILNGQGDKVEIKIDNLPQLTESLLKAMKESGKEVTFVKEEGGEVLYSWSFKGSELNDVSKAIALDISFSTSNSFAIDALVGNNNSLYIHFAHSGTLPAPALIRLYAGDKFKNGDKVNLYYYNNETGKAEEISKGLVVVIGGYVSFTITHCSDYFLTLEDLSKLTGTDTTDDTVTPDNTGGTGAATGDDMPVIPITVLMGLSLTGIVLLKRKRAYK